MSLSDSLSSLHPPRVMISYHPLGRHTFALLFPYPLQLSYVIYIHACIHTFTERAIKDMTVKQSFRMSFLMLNIIDKHISSEVFIISLKSTTHTYIRIVPASVRLSICCRATKQFHCRVVYLFAARLAIVDIIWSTG